MSATQCLNVIDELSYSQGFYSRLKLDLQLLKQNDPEEYESLLSYWDSQHFTDVIEFILFLEC